MNRFSHWNSQANHQRQIFIKAEGIKKVFQQGNENLEILKSLDLEIFKGESLCIVGPSGAGKSTILHILGTLDRPTEGQLYYEEQDVLTFSESELGQFRNKKMGFVFQFHYLFKEFTALENVSLPARIGGASSKSALEKATIILESLGLKDRLTHYPSELSGGEQQRVAIARAIVNQPEVIFADEPTGNLDTKNSRLIQEIFFKLWKDIGVTLVVVTHDQQFSKRFSRVLSMNDGTWEN